jgi:hypothetical protein
MICAKMLSPAGTRLMTYQRKPGAKSEATMMSFCGGLYFITLLVGLHVML